MTATEVLNPATLELIGQVAECNGADAEHAVTAALNALPAWRAAPRADRSARIGAIATALVARLPELAASLTAEAGQPLCESRDALMRVVRAYEAAARAPADPRTGPDADGREGRVVVVLAPPRASLLVLSSQVAAALVRGDVVVCVAAPGFAATTIRFVECLADLPGGVFNLLTGGEATQRSLLAKAGIGLVCCSAASEDAAVIRGQTRAQVEDLDLESLAPGPFVVCQDADLERSAAAIAWTCLHDAGQSYASCKHIYVERSIAGDFTTRLHENVGLLEIDDPAKAVADIGPLRSLAAAKRVEDQVMDALRDHAFPILGGRRFRPSGLPGHFFQPTILSGVPHDSKTGRARIYGPVMLVTAVADLAQALRHCTENRPTPGAAVLTSDVASAAQALAALSSGNYSVNDPADGAAQAWPLPAVAGSTGIATAPELIPKAWWFPYAKRSAG